MSCSSDPPVLDITKEIGKMLQQAIPLLRDLESLFAGLSTVAPGITEEDKIDIAVMPRAIHILISNVRVEIEMLTSQTLKVENWGPVSNIITTITSDVYQVLCDTKTILSCKELQPSDYTKAVNNMIGIIYTNNLMEKKVKRTPTAGSAFFYTSSDDVIALFPDYNKRLRDIGIES